MVLSKCKIARKNMIANQLKVSEVTDKALLDALASVQRESFVPEQLKEVAYLDEDIRLFHDRYLMEPLVFARLVQAAQISEASKVLIIGAATGYSAAVVSKIAAHVVAIESQREMADMARKNLRKVSAPVEVFSAALTVGYAMFAPYDVIIIEGAVSAIPEDVSQQLAEGGRLVTVVNKQQRLDAMFGLGTATCYEKRGGQLYAQALFECSVGVLAEFKEKQEFTF